MAPGKSGRRELFAASYATHTSHPFSCSCFLLSASALRRRSALSEPLLHLFPVDDVPPRGDVVGPAILVLQVVRVLPHVDPHDRLLPFHQRIVLVWRAGDREFAAVVDQPRPARSETSDARRAELFAEFREVAECAL